MKKGLKIFLLLLIIALIFVFAVCCKNGDDEQPDYTTIETPNLKFENGAYIVNLSSSIKKVDLTTYFSISSEATYEISKTEGFETTVADEVDLLEGENAFYVKVKSGDNEKVYKFLFIKKKIYSVVFKLEGQTEEVGSIQCEEGTKIEKPSYQKQGYTITWNYNFDTPITADTVILGTLNPIKYQITVSAPGLDIDKNSYEVEFGETVEITSPTKKGYEFTGWLSNNVAFDPEAQYNFTTDITIVPTFNKLIEYNIVYNLNGGINNENNPLKYTIEDEIIISSPSWENDTFVFDGWYTDFEFKNSISKIEVGTTETVVLYAKWNKVDVPQEPVKITTNVTIDADGYDCDDEVLEFVFGEAYTLPSIEREGYTSYWTLNGNTIPTSGVWSFEDADVTVSVAWTPVKYTVKYELDGGENNENNPTEVTIESEVTLNAPTKEFATFVGWYTDPSFENKVDSISQTTANLTLYALWQYTEVEITYDANGGEVADSVQTIIYGNDYVLLIPEKFGYQFDGWYNNDVLVPQSGKWTTNEDASLVAKWSLINYKIEYVLNGGTLEATNLKTEYTVEDKNFTIPIPNKSGQIFLGWSTSESSGFNTTLTIYKGMYSGDLTFIANWCDEKSSDGFLFNINEDGTASLMGYSGKVGDLTIPSEYNGYKVTSIANNAFNGYGDKIGSSSGNSFVKIYIPSTITRIGANAFANCDDLKVQYLETKEMPLETWVEALVIESGNTHVLDVIMSKRPAIGWYKYTK